LKETALHTFGVQQDIHMLAVQFSSSEHI